jgi:hypothetical protein|tara:strand:+ start:3268 stop:3435 length:168 start_codon:yes stop_codon:yes gene_type:complete
MARYQLVRKKDGTVAGVFSDELKKGIPADSDNMDWLEYLEWVKQGNVADPPVGEE